MVYSLHNVFLIGPASARSYIGVVGNNWLVGWLVNSVFSKTALRIFLIFCMKLGDYKSRKVTEPDFWKKFLIWRYSRKRLHISPKSDSLIFFSKTAQTIFFGFWPEISTKYDFNLNETWFSENFLFGDIWPRNRQNFVVFFQFAGPVNVLLFLGLVRPKSKWQLFQTFGK